MSQNVVGIDIGSASIRAVELKNATKSKPVVVKHHEVPIPEGTVQRGEVLDVPVIADALKHLWSTGGFSTKAVIIGMGGPRVLSRDLRVPRAPLARIRESLPFQVKEMLPVPVEDTFLDFYPISESEDESGPVVNGLLVAAIREAVNSNIQAVTGAGLKPLQVDLIPFALVRALAPVRTTQGLSAVVSIGANTTNVVIVLDGVPQFVRIIASGGDDVTRSLEGRLGMSTTDAEALKRVTGLAFGKVQPEAQPAVDIIFQITHELLTSVRNTLAYYVSTKPGHSLSRVVLSGGGSQLTGLADALGELASVPVELADPFASVPSAGGASSQWTAEQKSGMTTAFALALGTHA